MWRHRSTCMPQKLRLRHEAHHKGSPTPVVLLSTAISISIGQSTLKLLPLCTPRPSILFNTLPSQFFSLQRQAALHPPPSRHHCILLPGCS